MIVVNVALLFLLQLLAYHVNFFSTSSLLLMAQLSGKGSYEELASYSFGFPGRYASASP